MAVEVKKVYQYIKTSLTESNKITINNSYFFRNLDNVQLVWEVLEDGKVIQKGVVQNLTVAPRETITISLPIKIKQQPSGEYFLNTYYQLKEAEPFLEKRFVIAYEQMPLNSIAITSKKHWEEGTLSSSKIDNKYIVTGKNFTIEFDAAKGQMTTYKQKEQIILQSGALPAYWRAPTDNDIGAGLNSSLRKWRNAYSEGKLIAASMETNTEGSYSVRFKKELLNGEAQQEITYTVYGNGAVKVDNKFTAVKGKYPLMLRIGNDLELGQPFSNVEWYGRGPGENYWDRKSASLIGQYKQKVSEQYFAYARPQESGNKSEVRWATFTNSKGEGIRIEYADSLLNVSALPYSINDLDPEENKKQYHSGELTERDRIYLHVDLQQSGVQGIDSWGSLPLPNYRIPFKDHQYSYFIFPIK